MTTLAPAQAPAAPASTSAPTAPALAKAPTHVPAKVTVLGCIPAPVPAPAPASTLAFAPVPS